MYRIDILGHKLDNPLRQENFLSLDRVRGTVTSAKVKFRKITTVERKYINP